MYEKLEYKHSKVIWRPPDRWKVYTFPRTICNVARAGTFFNGVVASKKKGKKKQTGFDTLHSYLVNYNRCGKVLR